MYGQFYLNRQYTGVILWYYLLSVNNKELYMSHLELAFIYIAHLFRTPTIMEKVLEHCNVFFYDDETNLPYNVYYQHFCYKVKNAYNFNTRWSIFMNPISTICTKITLSPNIW